MDTSLDNPPAQQLNRLDLDVINDWIDPGSRVLDLGCGDGRLLQQLRESKQINGYGIEINPHNITSCIQKDINVIEQDVDQGLGNFTTNSFDIVVMAQALQAVQYPHLVLDEMLRVGKECIITFPNFGHWRCRLHLSQRGRMPVSKFMPYTWYNTPNIHFCTVKDFEELCYKKNIHILNRAVVDQQNRKSLLMNAWPNLLGETAVYRVTR